MCFLGHYQNETNVESTPTDFEINVYELMVMGLKIGIRYEEYRDMDFVTLLNLLDASMPKKKPKYRTATQKDIDAIT